MHASPLPVADHVEEVAVGEEVDARRVGEGEGDEAVVGRRQGRQQPVEDATELLAAGRKYRVLKINASREMERN